MHRKTIVAAGIFLSAVVFAFCSITTFAYSVSGTETQSTGASFQLPSLNNFNLNGIGEFLGNLSAPVQSYLNTIGSSLFGNSVVSSINTTIANSKIGTAAGWTIGDAFQKFDGWLYGVAGFRVSDFVGAIFGVITWALRLAQTVINWLLSLIH